jgi:hypothetical protein
MRLLFVLATVVAAPVWVGEYYYLVRANALEHNVVLYKTVGGKRSSLQVKGRMFGYGVDTSVPSNKWSSLRVEFVGRLFTVFSTAANSSKLRTKRLPTLAASGCGQRQIA